MVGWSNIGIAGTRSSILTIALCGSRNIGTRYYVVAERARDLTWQICQTREVVIVRGAVSPDHIHMLLSAPAQLAASKLVQYIKGRSSRRLQEVLPHLRKRSYWGQHLSAWGTFVRRWERLIRQRSRPRTRINAGTKTTSQPKSPLPPSLEPTLSRRRPQAASAARPTISRNSTHRL